MTLPRSRLIDPACTPYYHCTSRCVRRAYLCGKDLLTGNNYDHRRDWLESRLHQLADIFAIDVCAYAVMSNHYHVILHLNEQTKAAWSAQDVIERWGALYNVPANFEQLDQSHIDSLVALWRDRLGSISWFMKSVNEPLARLANKEDGCTGRFWEGRFESQALLDKQAVLKCMVYADLNPVRAKAAETPESSQYTSIRARLTNRAKSLAPMSDEGSGNFCLPISLREYALLVDWTGRQLRRGKRGQIDPGQPPIIERLARAGPRSWLDEMSSLSQRYFRAIGTPASLTLYRDRLGQSKLKGLVTSRT